MCIIHDCMDTSKTALPRLRVQNKMISGLGQLPVSLTGMVTHGHDDGAYAHYSNELWPNDSNFTVSSLAHLLRTLERSPSRDSKVLFEHPPHNDFFCKLLLGKFRCLEALPPATRPPIAPLKSLPQKMYLQLDSCADTNKNRFVMAYLSFLTARKVFKEIQFGFLMVGHTHEDIDAYFSYLSKNSKTPTPLSSRLYEGIYDFPTSSFCSTIDSRGCRLQGLHEGLSPWWG